MCYVLGSIQFFFNWYCSFTGGIVLDCRMIMGTQVMGSLVLFMSILRRDKNLDAVNDRHQILYSQGRVSLQNKEYRVITIMTESVLVGASTFYPTYYGL